MKELVVRFEKESGLFSIESPIGGNRLECAKLELNWSSAFVWNQETLLETRLNTPLGEMSGYAISTEPKDGSILHFKVAGPETGDFALLHLSVENRSDRQQKIRRYSVVCDGHVPLDMPDGVRFSTLDGLSGAGETQVREGAEGWSSNNLLVTWISEGAWSDSLVAGGLTYEQFAKYVKTAPAEGGICLNLDAEDPVGRQLEPGERWDTNDWFYLDLASGSPYGALEKFAQRVRQANNAKPNPYSFPTVCAWYVSTPMFGNTDWMNDTPGTVREIEAARDCGFLEYAPVAVRLVPDTYDGESVRREFVSDEEWLHQYYRYKFSEDRNTEQGWWDDEHWNKFGHYAKPYETSKKWAQAIIERGGIPLTYFQTGHVSYDYAKAFPGHMLGNDISELDRIFKGHNPYVVFDYTDPGFIEHLTGVWKHLREAGVAGLMFDYPNQAWIEDGGFEDPKATTTSAYLNVFRLAKEGLGPDSYIHERNVARKVPYLDATVGLVDSQRVWGDTDGVDPVMYRMCGLRWYKTRTLYAYDTDAKNLTRIAERSRDQLRQVLTLLYLLTGRILLANSFTQMSEAVRHDLSRVYPEHPESLSPRPVDMFESLDNPRTYVLAFSPGEIHLLLSNFSTEESWQAQPKLFEANEVGGVGLDPDRQYHAYDFWNSAYLGICSAAEPFQQDLRPSEARMLVFRPLTNHPQVISTDRHVLQGHVELDNVSWDEAATSLSGSAKLVAGERMTVRIAHNGWEGLPVANVPGEVTVEMTGPDPQGILEMRLRGPSSGPVPWSLNW
ncbi:MAG: hypothetical protein AB3N33_10625 [Puniceicoccaceae bacterium]